MLQILVFLVLATTAAVSFARFRDPLFPPVMQSAIWLLVLCVYWANQSVFYPLSDGVYFIFAMGVVMFALGSFLTTYEHRPSHVAVTFVHRRPDWFAGVLFWLPVIGLPLMWRRAIELASHGFTGFFLVDLRFALEGKEGSYGVLEYLAPVALASAVLHFVIIKDRRGWLRFLIAFATAAGYGILTAGRTLLLFLILSVFGVALITRRVKASRAFAGALVTGLVMFIGLGIAVGKMGGIKLSVSDRLFAIWDSIRLYMCGSLPAFDRLVTSEPPLAYGANMFRTVLALFAHFGLAERPHGLVQAFVKVPAPTNVYTVFQPYFADFSYFGACFIQFFLGMLHGLVYRKAGTGAPFWVVAYGLLLYPLCMQFFQDQYFNILSTWLQLGLVMIAYFYFSRGRSIEVRAAEGSARQAAA